jgi:hypothetical protein
MNDLLEFQLTGVAVKHLIALGTVPGIVVTAAAAQCGPGTGRLAVDGGHRATWYPPGDIVGGTPVDVSSGGPFTVTGANPAKWLHVTAYSSALVVGATADVRLVDVYNNGLAPADVTAAQAAAGYQDTWTVDLKNVSAGSVGTIHLTLDAAAVLGGTTLEISLDGAAWHTLGGGYVLTVPDLAAGVSQTLHFRRTIPAATASLAAASIILDVTWITPAAGTLAARGLWRIFAPACFRLYRSNVAPPLPGDTPWTTSASLPVTPADTFADGTWYVAVSWFNGIYDSYFLPVGPSGEP